MPESEDLEADAQVGTLNLKLPGEPEPTNIPIIRVKRIHNQPLTPNGFYGVLVPHDTKEREGYIIAQYKDTNISRYSTVVASACEGHAEMSVFSNKIIQIYNVAPQDGEGGLVEILIKIYTKTRFRLQTIVYY